MKLKLYDSLSRTTRPVEPVEPGRFLMYTCGPTVYSRIHVGNARPFVVALVLRRHLRRQGIDARVVCNVTDVNEKIDEPARARGIPSAELAREFTEAYIADTSRLGLGRPDAEPLVTESIPAIIGIIERLVERGLAYAAEGDVYYRVRAFDGYGRLSGQRVDELLAEGRVEAGAGKESPADFALWKARKPEEDSWWPSPWGDGRPGWHIECSAMALAELGETFDAHGGGLDLIFPHHENERAQSEGATGCTFARTWMHNGMLRFGGEKMSKSLGNIERLGDALDAHGAETLLLLLHRAHYRKPLDFTDETLAEARAACDRLREALARARRAAGGTDEEASAALVGAAEDHAEAFDDALDDDFSTPEALAALFDLAAALNRAVDAGAASAAAIATAADVLLERLDVLGLAGLDGTDDVPADVQALADERQAARLAREFARADALRDELLARGYVVKDTADGPVVERA